MQSWRSQRMGHLSSVTRCSFPFPNLVQFATCPLFNLARNLFQHATITQSKLVLHGAIFLGFHPLRPYHLKLIFNFSRNNSEHKRELVETSKNILDTIHKLSLHPQNKLPLYNNYIIPKLCWNITIADLDMTWIKVTH